MSYDLFAQEAGVIAEGQALLARGGFASEAERAAFAELLGNYEKLLRTTKRLVRLSDRNERELNRMGEERRRAAERISRQNKELEALSSKLAKYLSPQVYNSIFTGAQEVKLTSRRKKLTVFFSDIAGFTEATDRMEAEDLTHLLNQYLTEMSKVALAHGATIDKYIGDAIMIFFGDPETRGVREDALACVRMALAMQERMRELAHDWRSSGVETPLRCRIGIHTGYCTVGNFGGDDRMDYTIIGGTVNLASRLEREAAPGGILLSYETFAQVREEVHCEERGRVQVKGMAYPTTTYEAIGPLDELEPGARPLRAELAHLRLELDPRRMSAEEQGEAKRLLEEALKRLAPADPADEPPNIGREPSEPCRGSARASGRVVSPVA